MENLATHDRNDALKPNLTKLLRFFECKCRITKPFTVEYDEKNEKEIKLRSFNSNEWARFFQLIQPTGQNEIPIVTHDNDDDDDGDDALSDLMTSEENECDEEISDTYERSFQEEIHSKIDQVDSNELEHISFRDMFANISNIDKFYVVLCDFYSIYHQIKSCKKCPTDAELFELESKLKRWLSVYIQLEKSVIVF